MAENNYFERGLDYAVNINTGLELVFNQVLDATNFATKTEKEFADQLQGEFLEAAAQWFERPDLILDGKNLDAFLAELSETELLDFSYGVFSKLEYDLPEQFSKHLQNLSVQSREKLLAKLLTYSPAKRVDFYENSQAQSEIFLLCKILTVLSYWQDEKTSAKVLDWFLQCPDVDERIADYVGIFLTKQGDVAFTNLLAAAQNLLDNEANSEKLNYILQVLTDLGSSKAELQDESYIILRKAFKTTDNKSFIVFALGDLGSPRAIPLLKSYLEKNQDSIDETLYYDIISSLHKLGAQTSDLPDLSLRFALEKEKNKDA